MAVRMATPDSTLSNDFKVWVIAMKTELRKCAHSPCSCTAHDGDYCSPYCETAKDNAEIICGCEHVSCKVRTRYFLAVDPLGGRAGFWPLIQFARRCLPTLQGHRRFMVYVNSLPRLQMCGYGYVRERLGTLPDCPNSASLATWKMPARVEQDLSRSSHPVNPEVSRRNTCQINDTVRVSSDAHNAIKPSAPMRNCADITRRSTRRKVRARVRVQARARPPVPAPRIGRLVRIVGTSATRPPASSRSTRTG